MFLFLVLATACQNPDILSIQQGGTLMRGIKIGMTRDDVVRELGPPHKIETHGATEFLFYNTNWALAEAATQRNPIAVLHGKVVGMGKPYYDAFLKGNAKWTSDVTLAQPAWHASVNP